MFESIFLIYFLPNFLGEPPRVQAVSSPIAVSVNKPAVLECSVQGYPTPSVQWERQDFEPLSPDIRVSPSGSRLTIPRIAAHQSGAYVCTAENLFGLEPATIHVTVTCEFINKYRVCV